MLGLRNILDSNDVCVLWFSVIEFAEVDIDRLIWDCRTEILEDEEFQRISRYKMIDDRKRSFLSAILMKLVLADYYGIPPREVRVVRRKGLKPYFVFGSSKDSQISFNVSHDRDLVIIIVSKYSVGIDVMKSELPLRNSSASQNGKEAEERFFNNMKSIFHLSEWDYINGDISRFMHYWTIKEAFVKCIGLGLYIDPKRLQIEGLSGSRLRDSKKSFFMRSQILLDNSLQVSYSLL
ncbi:4'-phosphopantetheinyl transferase [Cryptosporidium felis]|nr:4'-phosphopantetheinyl transferase [Cryptosporidium felis]